MCERTRGEPKRTTFACSRSSASGLSSFDVCKSLGICCLETSWRRHLSYSWKAFFFFSIWFRIWSNQIVLPHPHAQFHGEIRDRTDTCGSNKALSWRVRFQSVVLRCDTIKQWSVLLAFAFKFMISKKLVLNILNDWNPLKCLSPLRSTQLWARKSCLLN